MVAGSAGSMMAGGASIGGVAGAGEAAREGGVAEAAGRVLIDC